MPGAVVATALVGPIRSDVGFDSAPGGTVTDAPAIGPSSAASTVPPGGPRSTAASRLVPGGTPDVPRSAVRFADFGVFTFTTAVAAPPAVPESPNVSV